MKAIQSLCEIRLYFSNNGNLSFLSHRLASESDRNILTTFFNFFKSPGFCTQPNVRLIKALTPPSIVGYQYFIRFIFFIFGMIIAVIIIKAYMMHMILIFLAPVRKNGILLPFMYGHV